MDKNEIERHLDVSPAHSIIVDVAVVDGAPRFLRTVTIHQGNSVTIEFEKARGYFGGNSEGGWLKYIAQYHDLDELTQDLEEFLGKPVMRWSNFTAEPYSPVVQEDPDPAASLKFFEDAVRHDAIKLPRRAKYQIASPYWRHIVKYGEFREDKIWEEQEEHLGFGEPQEHDGEA